MMASLEIFEPPTMHAPHFKSPADRAVIALALASLSACSQPQSQANNPAEMPAAPVAQNQAMQASPTPLSQRIMARLNGLSGEQDPRLAQLKQRISASAGITLVSLGTAQQATTYSAFLTFQFDASRMSQAQAVALIQGLESFAYVEADQPLQKR